MGAARRAARPAGLRRRAPAAPRPRPTCSRTPREPRTAPVTRGAPAAPRRPPSPRGRARRSLAAAAAPAARPGGGAGGGRRGRSRSPIARPRISQRPRTLDRCASPARSRNTGDRLCGTSRCGCGSSRTRSAAGRAGGRRGRPDRPAGDGRWSSRRRLPDLGRRARAAPFDLRQALDERRRSTSSASTSSASRCSASRRDGVGPGRDRAHLPAVGARQPGLRARPASAGCGRWSAAPDAAGRRHVRRRRLAGELAPGRAAARLVEAGARLAQAPLTWVVDPDLLETAERHVRRLPGAGAATARTRRRAAAPARPAAGWTALRAATAGAEVAGAALRRPRPRRPAPRPAARATTSAARAAGLRAGWPLLLGRPVTDDVAWPVDGFVDRGTLAALRAGPARRGGPRRPGAARRR